MDSDLFLFFVQSLQNKLFRMGPQGTKKVFAMETLMDFNSWDTAEATHVVLLSLKGTPKYTTWTNVFPFASTQPS